MPITEQQAKGILGSSMIGPHELLSVGNALKIAPSTDHFESAKLVPYTPEFLESLSGQVLLIFGMDKTATGSPLNILALRDLFGLDPASAEPCFYNQDWYVKENFVKKTLEPRWYLVSKTVRNESRSKDPSYLEKNLKEGTKLPSAILTAFAFFANYLVNKSDIVWKNDFVWCSDTDINGDRIYTGRYEDPAGLNKNGFNIHRHLSIKSNYGLAPCFEL